MQAMAEHVDTQNRDARPLQKDGRADERAAKTAAKKSIRFRLLAVPLVLAIAGFSWWLHARNFEDTDDAQMDGNISAVSPRVPGTVTAVHAQENQTVKAGDLLVELDAADLEVAAAQARAAVAQAEAGFAVENPNVAITQTSNRASVQSAQDEVENARADLSAAQRDLEQAEAQNKFAQLQRDRAEQLVRASTISRADYDQRVSQADVAKAAVQAAQQHVAQRRARLATAETRFTETQANAPRQLVAREAGVQVRRANLELAHAQLRQAELNLSYAKIVAPAAGILGKKAVNVGDRLQPGQQLFALTQTGDLWVTANFRETQIERMRAGQKARLHVDAIDRVYTGEVESFAGATGSRYSLLPPENASGNYVKVVQRIPVRIRLDPGQPEVDRLRPGMSVEPSVRVR
jgi:membrane fusion protein (multidrug efflux system)